MKLICVMDEDGKREYINTKQIVSFYSETLSHNESLTYIYTVDQCVHIIKNSVRDILDYLTNQEESPIKHNPKILLVYGENTESEDAISRRAIEDIKAEIKEQDDQTHYPYGVISIRTALQIIDKHISGKEQE